MEKDKRIQEGWRRIREYRRDGEGYENMYRRDGEG